MFILFIFAAGCAVGSFINVLESRLAHGEDIFVAPSHCDFCQKKLKFVDLVPIFSWIFHAGKSRCCHKRLSPQYPIIELIAGIGFIAIYLRENIASLLHCSIADFNLLTPQCMVTLSNLTIQLPNHNFLAFSILCLLFVLCFAIFLQDLKYQAIHSGLLYTLLITTVSYLLISSFFESSRNFQFSIFLPRWQAGNFQINYKFIQHLSAALVVSLPFYLLFKLSRERWLGEGDVWLTFWMGLFLGFPRIIFAIYAAFILGGTFSLIILLLKLKKMRDTISLGPFLLIGTLIALLF